MPPDTYVNQIQRVGTPNAGLAAPESALVFDDASFALTHEPNAITTATDGGTITGRIRVALAVAAVVTWELVRQALSVANSVVDINGQAIKQGPLYQAAGRATTVGGATSAFTQPLAAPIVAGSHASVDLHVTCNDGVYWYQFDSAGNLGWDTIGAGTTGSNATQGNTFPISPRVLPAYSGGILTVSAGGPTVAITAITGAGAGGCCRVTISAGGGAGLTTALTGTGLTVTGVAVGGTVEANGVHLGADVAQVSAGSFDLLAVPFVHAYTSGGTVTETTPRTLAWGAVMRVLTP